MAPPQGASGSNSPYFLAKPPRSPRGSEAIPLRTLRLGEIKSLLAPKIRLVQPEPGTSLNHILDSRSDPDNRLPHQGVSLQPVAHN